MKINIVGTSASGKSTFGKQLAEKIGVPFFEMDAIFWEPNWTEPPDEVFFKRLEAVTTQPNWVLDGNYTRTIPIKWQKIDTVIWLDFSFSRTLYQSLSRAINRSYTKKELWPNTGNRESFKKMFSADSIVLWCIRNYSKNKKKYVSVMHDPTYAHIQFVRLTTPAQAADYLRQC